MDSVVMLLAFAALIAQGVGLIKVERRISELEQEVWKIKYPTTPYPEKPCYVRSWWV